MPEPCWTCNTVGPTLVTEGDVAASLVLFAGAAFMVYSMRQAASPD